MVLSSGDGVLIRRCNVQNDLNSRVWVKKGVDHGCAGRWVRSRGSYVFLRRFSACLVPPNFPGVTFESDNRFVHLASCQISHLNATS